MYLFMSMKPDITKYQKYNANQNSYQNYSANQVYIKINIKKCITDSFLHT